MSTFELFQGDCIEQMKNIPDSSIDLVLTDPPYGTTQNKWDSVIPFPQMWEQIWRVAKPNAAVVLFAQTPFDKVLGASAIEHLRYEWIWDKKAPTGFLNATKAPLKKHENILVFYKNLPTYNPQMLTVDPVTGRMFKSYTTTNSSLSDNYGTYKIATTTNIGTRYPHTILSYSRDTPQVHPTQKPIDLLAFLIETYTNPGGIVLDFTMGSGSTGVACKSTGRNFIGIELDSDIFTIASTRISEEHEKIDNRVELPLIYA